MQLPVFKTVALAFIAASIAVRQDQVAPSAPAQDRDSAICTRCVPSLAAPQSSSITNQRRLSTLGSAALNGFALTTETALRSGVNNIIARSPNVTVTHVLVARIRESAVIISPVPLQDAEVALLAGLTKFRRPFARFIPNASFVSSISANRSTALPLETSVSAPTLGGAADTDAPLENALILPTTPTLAPRDALDTHVNTQAASNLSRVTSPTFVFARLMPVPTTYVYKRPSFLVATVYKKHVQEMAVLEQKTPVIHSSHTSAQAI
ncbi:hypothetical protein F53441_1471 [Fusarium austroafricanum]|uniref:Uncharacterized protein n=1 Tax=Fusarium austroafricanum TaxID=2364996 RepID=A0A8H4KUI1_9HYPO|nr:hypothetical protein F53441_1471 [Fusarium austroafricanum]